MSPKAIAKLKCTMKDMIGSWLLLKVTIVCEVSWDIPNHSSMDWGGFVSERRPGVRGGNGTSQPNFTSAENAPPMSPTIVATLRRRRAGSVLPSSEVIQVGMGPPGWGNRKPAPPIDVDRRRSTLPVEDGAVPARTGPPRHHVITVPWCPGSTPSSFPGWTVGSGRGGARCQKCVGASLCRDGGDPTGVSDRSRCGTGPISVRK